MKYDVYDLLEYVNYEIKKNTADKFVINQFYSGLRKHYTLPEGESVGLKNGYKNLRGKWVRATILLDNLDEVDVVRKTFFVPSSIKPRKVGEYGPPRAKEVVQDPPSSRTDPLEENKVRESEVVAPKKYSFCPQTGEPVYIESDETVIRSLALNDDKWGSLNKLGHYLGLSHKQVADFVRYKQKKKIWKENIDWCEIVHTSPSSQSIFEFTGSPMAMWTMACQAKGDRAEQVQRLMKEIISGDTKKSEAPLLTPAQIAQIVATTNAVMTHMLPQEVSKITTTTIEKTVTPKIELNTVRHDEAMLSSSQQSICQPLYTQQNAKHECSIVHSLIKKAAKIKFKPDTPASDCTWHKIRQRDFEELVEFIKNYQLTELDVRRIAKFRETERGQKDQLMWQRRKAEGLVIVDE